jgi:hypothetical protein
MRAPARDPNQRRQPGDHSASSAQALAALGIPDGSVGVIGGPDVFEMFLARIAPQTDKTCILPITIAEDLARSLTHDQTTVNRQLASSSCF